MAIIGFDDQVIKRQDGEDRKLSNDETLKLMTTIEEARKNLYISPERMKKFEATYGCVVVHDFNDEYHLTDEEREAQNRFYKLFAKLNKCKRKYRRIDEYVECARISIQCLEEVSNNNSVYKSDEFMTLVLKGKINVNGWFYPRYNGKDRKQLSWDYISEFILTDKPASDLIKSNVSNDEFLTEEELDEQSKTLFTDEEWERIFESPDPIKSFREEFIVFDEDRDKITDDTNLAFYSTKDETRSLLKQVPELLILAKDMRRELKSVEQLNRYGHDTHVSDIRMDDIEVIEEYDSKRKFTSDSDIPKFKGDITNSKDYHKYIRALELYNRTQLRENYNGKMRTPEEIQELKLKEALESAGWNIRALYDNKEKAKRLQRAKKADKKREKRLKEQLTQVQDRSKRRMGIDVTKEKSSKKNKSKKKKNKEAD